MSVIFTRTTQRVYQLSSCVCPSLRPSVTSPRSTETAKRRITQTTSHDTSGTLVFFCRKSRQIETGSPPMEAPNTGGVS